jgi:hypothetical protein
MIGFINYIFNISKLKIIIIISEIENKNKIIYL